METPEQHASRGGTGWTAAHPRRDLTRRGALGVLVGAASTALFGCDDKSPGWALRLNLSRPTVVVPPVDALALPPRKPNAPTGSRFMQQTRSMSRGDREHAVLEEILGGNVPSFERKLLEVPISHRHNRRLVTGQIRVMPDYLSIGSDDDFIRMPMNGRTAQRIANATACTLPTSSLVDAIYAHASIKVTSSALAPGEEMMSNAYFEKHNREIEDNRRRASGRLGDLLAGPKKDVVISRRLQYEPHQLAIYGWFRSDGSPIQFLSTFHEDTYVDYTHGVRLVAENMLLDGEVRRIADVLRDAELWPLVSNEGTIAAKYAP